MRPCSASGIHPSSGHALPLPLVLGTPACSMARLQGVADIWSRPCVLDFRSGKVCFRSLALPGKMAARGRLRVLALAGFRQSERGFREKTGALRKALRGRAELVCLSGPHLVAGAAAPEGARPDSELCLPEEQPRGWWFSEQEADIFNALSHPTVCRGLEEALGTVAQALKKLGPFDGLLGFSQGAALAALVCALGQAGDPRFPLPKFIILVSGFCPRGLGLKEPVLEGPLSLPSLHVFGDADCVIPSQESMQLASRFSGAVTLTHSGGHFIPAAAAQRQVYLKFLDQFAD